MKRSHGRRRSQGVTLVEWVVVLAVLAILAIVAAPAFRGLWRRHQVQTATESLWADLTYARHEAVQRGMFVSVCPSKTGLACTDQVAYGGGWIVYAYPIGGMGANRAYASGVSGFDRLRYTVPSGRVVANATDPGVVTFGQQGQFKSTSERPGVTWRLCAASGADDAMQGEVTSDVPGVELVLGGSGSLQQQRLSVGDSCLPSPR
ncbi:GspH/FimT family pseudopilin [Dyella jiangningensis]|uniref:GspH/FimT family pseudopilin n=1 Tax=Dyella jiangningensis TaxID=1379159 RepID=UPI00240F5EB4|nr:GspH/FimT family pseudopilin [Dyella jiangningensis]MDG2537554.1 GspH/FimT family pseudopilin [Dyella jiangningensis]